MIRKPCDNCDRVIEVDDELAGAKVACEACGDINVMPAAGEAAAVAAGSRAAQLGLPPDEGPEQEVLKVRPAMLRARPLLFIGLVLLVVMGITGFAWGMYGMPNTVKTLAKFAGGIGAVVALGALGAWKMKALSAALEITNKRTVHRQGLLSKATSEVVHDNIRNVQVTQTFWQRLWNVGTLGLSSSGQDGIEIEISDIPRPERVREVIDAYRPLG
ncbi:MAG: PH domain-containing protein [Planctomycetota bacterium]|nr:PH domain-containing protein [Planctomycetota bacterium]